MVVSTCDVCKTNPSVGVACCSYGPMSLAYCSTCLSRGAEPFYAFPYLLDDVADGRPDALNSDRLAGMCVYKDGEYVSWQTYLDRRAAGAPDYQPIPANPRS